MRRYLKKSWLIPTLLVALMSCFTLASCSDDDEPKPSKESEAIRGYWVCNGQGLALEILSSEEYYLSKYGSFENINTPDNVYQLWEIGGNSPKLCVSWTSVIGGFNFSDANGKYYDKPRILSYDENSLSLSDVDYYNFNRISKYEFNSLVGRPANSNGVNGSGENGGSGNENGGSSDGGNEGGNEGGGSNSHHYPCKSCDESGDCWNCFGTGKDPITNKKCNTCHGTGKCQICHGKGYIIV